MGKPAKPREWILFIRVPEDIAAVLDRRAEHERKNHPGRRMSRTDVAREILWAALQERVAR